MQSAHLRCHLLLKAKAVKGKRGRSEGREASPALQPTRVSKRQKAKAEAQAADAAQQEAEEDHTSEDNPFVGAATQVSPGLHLCIPRACSLNHHQSATSSSIDVRVPSDDTKQQEHCYLSAITRCCIAGK